MIFLLIMIKSEIAVSNLNIPLSWSYIILHEMEGISTFIGHDRLSVAMAVDDFVSKWLLFFQKKEFKGKKLTNTRSRDCNAFLSSFSLIPLRAIEIEVKKNLTLILLSEFLLGYFTVPWWKQHKPLSSFTFEINQESIHSKTRERKDKGKVCFIAFFIPPYP